MLRTENGECTADGKVTVGLASYWPCVRLQWLLHLWGAHGLSKEDEHHTDTHHGEWYSLPYLYREHYLF